MGATPNGETSLDYLAEDIAEPKMLVSILVRFYSSAAPRAELLNHLVNQPGTGEPPPEALPLPGLGIVYVSRIGVLESNAVSIGHVARRCYPPIIIVCASPQAGHSFRFTRKRFQRVEDTRPRLTVD